MPSRRRRRWLLWVLLLASVAGFVVSYAGHVMAGSFTISNPDRLAYWQRVATTYLGLTALSLVGIAVAVVALARPTGCESDEIERAG